MRNISKIFDIVENMLTGGSIVILIGITIYLIHTKRLNLLRENIAFWVILAGVIMECYEAVFPNNGINSGEHLVLVGLAGIVANSVYILRPNMRWWLLIVAAGGSMQVHEIINVWSLEESADKVSFETWPIVQRHAVPVDSSKLTEIHIASLNRVDSLIPAWKNMFGEGQHINSAIQACRAEQFISFFITILVLLGHAWWTHAIRIYDS